jgi:transcriptional regulator GlxA family with amidase domain
MNQRDNSPPVPVSLAVLPETTPTSLFGLYEVLSSVGHIWSELTGEPTVARPMAVRLVGPRRGRVIGAGGVPITPHVTFAEAKEAGVVIVTDLSLPVDGDPRGRWPEAAAWLRVRYDAGAIICSVCTGAVLLAEAGLLDGLEATSHWSATDLFRRYYPAVRLRAERILSPAGPEHRLVTCGGMGSWEELALYLIARFSGEAEAVRIAKVFVLGDRSEGQLPFAAMARGRRHDDAVIASCQGWLARHYDEPQAAQRMLVLSRLPVRSFNRRFRAATGYSPVEYLQTLRIEEAKQLLETTREPAEAIARRVGYEDVAFFRRLFKRRTAVTPARYRQRFGTTGRVSGAVE